MKKNGSLSLLEGKEISCTDRKYNFNEIIKCAGAPGNNKSYTLYFEIRQVELKLIKSLGFKMIRLQTREMLKILGKSRLSSIITSIISIIFLFPCYFMLSSPHWSLLIALFKILAFFLLGELVVIQHIFAECLLYNRLLLSLFTFAYKLLKVISFSSFHSFQLHCHSLAICTVYLLEIP